MGIFELKHNNMKKKLKTIAVALLVITAFMSCKKDSDDNETGHPSPVQTDNYTSLKDFHDKNEVQAQSFTLNANTGGTLTGIKGTIITIPPTSFETYGGSNVTGNVTV